MLRSNTAGLAVLALVACARTSENPPVVTAPVASATTAAASASAAPVASAPAASTSASASPGLDSVGPVDDADAGTAQFRACQADSDCVAVKRNGCCHNGWLEAVNASQKDAYAQSFTCPQPRPICPMYIIRDTRVPKCDGSTHLCSMVRTQP
jgi:hypothetical protein